MANVLVVDREATSRSLIAEVLSDFGDRVRVSDHGSNAVQLARREHFDVLILDEDTCDRSAFHSVVQDAPSQSLRARIVSLRTRNGASAEAQFQCTDDRSVVNKPVSIGELLRTLHAPITRESIPRGAGSPATSPLIDIAALSKLPIREARETFERAYLNHHLLAVGGRVASLADRVGMERTHLYRKLQQLGVL